MRFMLVVTGATKKGVSGVLLAVGGPFKTINVPEITLSGRINVMVSAEAATFTIFKWRM